MKMQIEMIPEAELVYIRRVGPYGMENIQTMEKLKAWASTKGLLNDESIILGIPWDNPAVIKPEDCRYDAGLIVSAVQQMRDDGVHFGRISSGEYAVFEIDHTAQALALAWSQLFLELGNVAISWISPVRLSNATQPSWSKTIVVKSACRLVESRFNNKD